MNRRDDPLFSRCFNYEPPEGWQPIVDRCIADIRAMLEEAGIAPGVVSIRQIKEKFGRLCIYFDVDGLVEIQERVRDRIETAEREAGKTCQDCGQPGTLNITKRGWHATLCDAHRPK